MKRLFLYLFASVLCLGAHAEAYDRFTATTPEGVEMTFTVISEVAKTCAVGYNYSVSIADTTAGELTVPTAANGYTVVEIGQRAFYGCSRLTNVHLPSAITTIGIRAFFGCSSLQKMVLPTALTDIGEYAFTSCNRLREVTIPAKVKSIGENAFYCRNLQAVHSLIKMPFNIPYYAFRSLPDDAVLYVPKGRVPLYKNTEGWKLFPNIVEETELGEGTVFTATTDDGMPMRFQVVSDSEHTCLVAPHGVDALFPGTATIPAMANGYYVIGLAPQAFKDCLRLTKVVMHDGIATVGSEAFSGCPNLVIVDWPEHITTIPDRAFQGCEHLSYVSLPEGVAHIGTEAFAGCTALTDIVLPSTVAFAPDSKVFDGCTALNNVISHVASLDASSPAVTPAALNIDSERPLYVPQGTKTAYQTAWQTYDNGRYADYAQYLIEGEGPSYTIRRQDFVNDSIYLALRQYQPLADGILTYNEMLGFTELSFPGIDSLISLKGLEPFRNLRTLNVRGKKLLTIDVSPFPLLTTLNCMYNHITGIDLSHNWALETLNLGMNKEIEYENRPPPPYPNKGFPTLDLTHNRSLQWLDCEYSGVEHLLIDSCYDLRTLRCNNDSLRTFAPTANTRLEKLYCDNNPLRSLDITANTKLTSLAATWCQLTEIDFSKNLLLENFDLSRNRIRKLDLSLNPNLIYYYCNNNLLEDINFGYNDNLTHIRMDNNRLATLDVSGLPALFLLYVDDNLLEQVDFSHNPALYWLHCAGNRLTSLDLSQNPDIHQLYCNDNRLFSLDASVLPALNSLKAEDQVAQSYIIRPDGGEKVGMYVPADFDLQRVSELKVGERDITDATVIDYQGGRCLLLGDTPASTNFAREKITYIYDMKQIPEKLADRVMNVSVNIDANLLGIETINNDQLSITHSPWYTLDGTQLKHKPTQKGLYLHRGRKVLVK